MKGLETLIRLARRRVDETRARQAALERQREEHLKRDRRLTATLALERRAAQGEVRFAFAAYVDRVAAERAEIATALEAVDVGIAEVGEELGEAYREFKKYDLTQAEHERRRQQAEARLEQAVLDEVAIDRFRRQGGAAVRPARGAR